MGRCCWGEAMGGVAWGKSVPDRHVIINVSMASGSWSLQGPSFWAGGHTCCSPVLVCSSSIVS